MKALVYTRPHEMQLQDRPLPDLADQEVVLQIEAVGICGSDLHAWHGKDPRRQPGLVLGHEFVGRIARSAAPGFEPGTRWTGNPLITCGSCDYCVQGRNNLCTRRTMVGMTRPGAYAEYMSIPAASLVAIPQDMPALTAAPTEPAATAWHALALSLRALARPLHECRALVIGGGAIGILAAQRMQRLGVRALTVSEPNPGRRATLAGAVRCEALDPRAAPLPGEAYDYVLDAVGSAVTRTEALRAVKPGGVIMHVGLQDWASEIDMRRLTLAEITLLGTYTYTTADLRATVAALAEGAFGDLAWVEARRLEQGPQAFVDLDRGAAASPKIVLCNGPA
ncbi:MAG: alcohol dehydrogenase catalytic domain-containing protein [Burkholderiales bacterium]|nr:alcohol dehydrogenase catalytic domain-containing protein [Burkholderiales bacterium]